MSEIVVDKLVVSYRSSGTGKPVLLLHGWGDSKETFLQLQNSLQEFFEVTALDLPGFGNTQMSENQWDLNDYAAFVSSFCKKAKIRPYAVVGHSNGGAITVRAQAAYGLEAEKIVLIASSGVRNNGKTRKKILGVVAKAAKQPTRLLPKKYQNKLKRKAYTAIGSELFVAEHMKETFKKIVTDDIQESAKRVSIPCLLIYGSNDSITPVADGEILKNALQNAQLKVVTGVGHFPHHDAHKEIQTELMKFLS